MKKESGKDTNVTTTDCVSRAEAIKALEYDLSIEADGGLDKYKTVIKDLLNAIYNTQKKAIEDLPSVQPKQNEWIPVSERLPEKNGEYLITGRQGAVNKRRYHDGHWYGNWSVLAWMPLPQPYKAESEVKENE